MAKHLGSRTLVFGSLTFVGSIALATACSANVDSGEGVTSTGQEIINGTIVTPQSQNPGVVAVFQPAGSCSGSLIRTGWVLTARHCVTTDGTATGPLVSSPSSVKVTRAINPGGVAPADASSGQKIIADSGQDFALVRISPEIAAPLPLYDGNASQLSGTTVIAMGYGLNTASTGYGTLRKASLAVTSVGSTTFGIGVNSGGQTVWRGDSGGPSFQTDILGRLQLGVAGVHQTGDGATIGNDGVVPNLRSWIKRRQFVPGDVNGDGIADITLTGGGLGSIPVAFSQGNGNFAVSNLSSINFPTWTSQPNAKILSGDFNGDGLSDIALTGPSGFGSLPLALSNGNGTFTITNSNLANFPAWAALPNVKAIPGDFNGDGRDDVALTGASGFGSIPIAFSNGDGSFNVSNLSVASFPAWAATANVKAIAGDFDGDGRDDIALTGATGFGTVPIAFSNGDGTFTITNKPLASFPGWAATANAVPVSGDFNGDGRDDIALTGPSSFTTVPVALSNGDGTFKVVNSTLANFPTWAASQNAKAIVGDYNADGRDDIALTGAPGFGSIPVAFSVGNGTFAVSNQTVANFPVWASTPGAVTLSGHKAQ